MARKKRTITKEEKEYLLNLKPEDIDLDLLNELFSDTASVKDAKVSVVPSKFNTFDEFTLEAKEYINSEKVLTNCGLFIFNKFLVEPYLKDYTGYVNFELDKSGIGKIDSIMAEAIMLDETGELTKSYIAYLDGLCWLGFSINTQICSSINLNTAKPLPKTDTLKKKLLKENEEAIKNNDAIAYARIQDELVAAAEKELKDDPSLELYTSGARGSMDNAYRQWLLTKGPVWNASKNEFDIMTNSLHEGIPKDKLPTMANAIVSGFYPKAIGTAESGYQTKRIAAAFQGAVLDERGSDCGTTKCTEVILDKTNVKMYMYNFIRESNGKYTRLEPTNQSKYMGKLVKIRTADYCTSKKLCNLCAGDGYYLLDIEYLGLTFSKLSNSTLQAKMKKSHDSTVRVYDLDTNKLFEQ